MMSHNERLWALNQNDLELLALSLKEDLAYPYLDITSEVLFEQNKAGHVYVINKQASPIVLSGLIVVEALISQFFPDCKLKTYFSDQDTISPGEKIFEMEGRAIELLMLERTILNYMQRLSGIATLTAKFVGQVRHTTLKILDTRKTTPGMRHLEKYAVFCGGGVNHRMGLYDALMIKDTHIDSLGGLDATLAKIKNTDISAYPLIIEVRNRGELEIVLQHYKRGLRKESCYTKLEHDSPATRVLLDNMSLSQLRECVALCKGFLATEASGNISLDNIKDIAETGVDYASVGKITHSAGVVDLSMRAFIK